jgi:hypothetical protein
MMNNMRTMKYTAQYTDASTKARQTDSCGVRFRSTPDMMTLGLARSSSLVL